MQSLLRFESNGKNPQYAVNPNWDFRCDEAEYLPAPGCIFDKAESEFVIQEQRNPYSGRFILDALDGQGRLTKPTVDTGVVIPGSRETNYPLTRNYWNEALRQASRDKSVNTCILEFPDEYPAEGIDCDEYPFASTYQGSATIGDTNRHYAVQPLPAGDNRSVGAQLVAHFNSDRILDQDPFWVYVEPCDLC